MSAKLASNSSPLSLLTVLKPGGSSCFSADSKPPKSVDDMIQLMKTRELVVTDENNLKSMLYNCNYYRLSGYFRVFQIDPSSG
ncbi:DNA-binding protein, partial [Bifidobacteriaceae bacterium VN002]